MTKMEIVALVVRGTGALTRIPQGHSGGGTGTVNVKGMAGYQSDMSHALGLFQKIVWGIQYQDEYREVHKILVELQNFSDKCNE